jgi:hypothetical protein
MPNNLVFNNVPGDLKTQIYGTNGSIVTALSVNGSGNVLTSIQNTPSVNVNNTVTTTFTTVTATFTDVSIGNTPSVNVNNTPSVNVNNTVTTTFTTVTATFTDVTIGNTPSVNVNNTPSVNVNNTVTTTFTTVTATFTDVTIGNTPSVNVNNTVNTFNTGATFTYDNVTVNSGPQTGTTLLEDTSQQAVYSFYVLNTSANTLSVMLQDSPTNNGVFVNDSSALLDVPQNTAIALSANFFLNYTRLYYDAGAGNTPSFIAYYNARV